MSWIGNGFSANPDAIGTSLAQALRYVAAWRGKTIVVKFGGAAVDSLENGTVPEDLVLLQQAGVRPILVHGGGPEITRELEKSGHRSEFVDGLRVTDEATMEVVERVLGGTVNKRLVNLISRAGGRGVGVSGKDARVLHTRPHARTAELGFVGEVERVEPRIVQVLLEEGFLPVVASLGVGSDGHAYNVNADTAAAALAVAVGADKLVLLTDVAGIYREIAGGRELLSELSPDEARLLVTSGAVTRGMIPKVSAALGAVEGGVPSAHIVGAETPHSLLLELFTRSGIGTMIHAVAPEPMALASPA
ncbi:MAG TPA: acetylglutamate kinase [Thermoanaerobaculia bacterium]|nr:acetylglutamate kinase [Thermoanaerobaculia bacterium]